MMLAGHGVKANWVNIRTKLTPKQGVHPFYQDKNLLNLLVKITLCLSGASKTTVIKSHCTRIDHVS